MSSSDAPYERASRYLTWAPFAMLILAVVMLLSRWNHSVQFASLFVLIAYVHWRWLPRRYVIADDGLALTFPFGRRVFLPKATVTVRMEVVGAFALTGRRRRLGYPLLDSLLYQPGASDALRNALARFGYRVIG
jgi:hypothetical protein